MNIQQKPVVNYSQARFGYKPEAIVIHIAQGSLSGAYSWFNNPTSQVSSHYMIGKNGEIWQFVNENNTAWHAGGINQPNWSLLKGNVNPNFYTVGIEHEGFTGEGWSDAMYRSSGELIGTLCRNFGIPLDRNHVIGHYQINSVSRKSCPGSGVDFNKLISIALNFYEDPIMIQELQAQVNNLHDQINNLNKQVSDLQAAYNLVNSQFADARSANDNLKAQLADAQATNGTLAQKNQELTARIDQMASGNTDAQVQVLRQNITDLSIEVKNLQDNQKLLNSKIAQLQDENTKLKAGNTSTGQGGIGDFFSSLIGKITGGNH